MPGKNIEELEKEIEHLKKTVEDLRTINQLARIISSTMPVDQILDEVVAASVKAIKAEQGTISLLANQKEKEETGECCQTKEKDNAETLTYENETKRSNNE